MEINKTILEKVVEFEYFENFGNPCDYVKFENDTDDYWIEVILDSNMEFRCQCWVNEEPIELDQETLDWLYEYAEESLAYFHEEMMDEQRRKEIAFDYFMSANFEKY